MEKKQNFTLPAPFPSINLLRKCFGSHQMISLENIYSSIFQSKYTFLIFLIISVASLKVNKLANKQYLEIWL